MKRKYKAAIFIAAGGALVITLASYLIWGKKVTVTPINPNPNPNPNPKENTPNAYEGVYGSAGDVYGGGGDVWVNPGFYPMSKFKVVTSGSNLNVRETASSSGKILSSLSNGAIIFAKPSLTSGWHEYSIDGYTRTGYVSSAYLKPA